MPPKKVRSPIKDIHTMVSTNPNVEHAFVKTPTKKVCECSNRKEKEHTTINREAVKKYLGEETRNYSKIHTHPANKKFSLIPSPQDIFNLLSLSTKRSHTIYVTGKKEVLGTIHYMVKNETVAKEIFNRYTKFKKSILESKTLQEKLSSTLHKGQTLEKLYQSFTIYNTLMAKENGVKYFSTKYDTYMKEHEKTKNPNEELFKKINFLTENLLRNKKNLLEIWNLLGIKIRYTPNKKKGYRFDPKTIDFIKT